VVSLNLVNSYTSKQSEGVAEMSLPGAGGGSGNPQASDKMSIHVREDSDKDLLRLFDHALHNTPLAGGMKPMKERNLPASFWQPPPMGSKSHSRENSLDGGLLPPSHHSRANSCPATLQQTLAVAAQHQQVAGGVQHSHTRHQSFDVGGGCDAPLPPGWEMAKTPNGTLYFMNHITRTTQWEDPRKTMKIEMLAGLPGGTDSSRAAGSPVSEQQQQKQQQQLGPLKDGWEQTFTPQGTAYFIHHPSKRTTWEDPRLLKAGGVAMAQQHPRLERLASDRLRIMKKLGMQGEDRGQTNSAAEAVSQAGEMLRRQSLSDQQGQQQEQFVGRGDPTEVHNRQESADSGLGGMGSNCNLGIIQEDMVMETMETDLDTTLTESTNHDRQETGGGMDTDELIPTIPELGGEFSTDYIHTILNPNKDSSTWL